MPKYRVTELTALPDRLVEAGEIVEWNGTEPGPNLEPVDDAAKAVKAAYEKREAERAAGLLAAQSTAANAVARAAERVKGARA